GGAPPHTATGRRGDHRDLQSRRAEEGRAHLSRPRRGALAAAAARPGGRRRAAAALLCERQAAARASRRPRAAAPARADAAAALGGGGDRVDLRLTRRPMPDLPSHTRVVVIGGGIVGCSVAYHLAKRGCKDVLLLERRQLTCGTTWHAAGLVGQLRATRNLTRLAQYTTQLYEGLERETGQATGFRQVGSIAVAASAARCAPTPW